MLPGGNAVTAYERQFLQPNRVYNLKFFCSQISTDLHNKCTQYFTGTSASAPQGAGIVALVLEAK